MSNLEVLFFVAYLTCSFSEGQVENLIGLPVKYDLLEKYQGDSEFINDDIWGEIDLPKADADFPSAIVQELCEKFDLELNHQLLECENLEIVPKNLKVSKHDIRKRDVKEEAPERSEDINDDIFGDGNISKIDMDFPRSISQELCEKFDLFSNNQLLECANLQVVPKSLKVSKHEITKRDVKEELEEGSGEETQHEKDETLFANQSLPVPSVDTNSEPEAPREDSQENEKPEEKETPEDNSKAPTEPEETKNEPETVPKADDSNLQTPGNITENVFGSESTTVSETGEDSAVVRTLGESPSEVDKVPSESEKSPEDASASEQAPGVIAESAKTSEGASTEDPSGSEKAPEVPKTDEVNEANSEDKAEVGKGTDGGRVMLGETAGKERENEPEKTGRKENVVPNQSGVAVVNTGVAGAGGSNSEEPKSGESSEGTGRKDNTILIALFAAVLLVGAAAVAYNYIKKRKNRANNSRTEQNGTAKTEDPEEGREMRPLMTGEQKSAVEFKDEK